jgi:hypothetical protein
MNTVFALTSWGNGGVPWIMACLNLHPQIRAYSNLANAVYSPLGRELSASDYLDAMARLNWPDCATVGDVHGVNPGDLASLHRAFGSVFRGGHLTGHPVQRLAGSLYFSRAVGRDWRFKDYLAMWTMTPDHPRARAAFPILGEDGDYIPAAYMQHVNGVTSSCSPTGPLADPLFKIDELLHSDGAWAALIEHLSGGALRDSGGYWKAMEGQVLNVAHEPLTATPREVWDAFDPYVRDVVAGLLTEDARAVYESLGYDLSFVR